MRPPRLRRDRLDGGVDAEANHYLSAHGAVILEAERVTISAFEQFSRTICKSFQHVGTRAKRRRSDGDGFTTNVFENNFILFAHCEGAYRPLPPPPDVCFFLCLTPPVEQGGETTLVDGCKMLERIPAALAARLEQHGIVYSGYWSRERWQAELGVHEKTEAASILSKSGRFAFHWDGPGADHLAWRYHASAIQAVTGGKKAFANGLLAHLSEVKHRRYDGQPVYTNPQNAVHFGTGEEISTADVNALIDAQDSVAYPHRWRQNELLILDNRRFLHGRTMTLGDCERVLASRFGRFNP